MHQAEKTKRGKYQHLLDHPLMKWVLGYSQMTQWAYLHELDLFFKFAKTSPDEVATERRADLKKENETEKYRYEERIVDFYRKRLGEKPASAKNAIKALRHFFSNLRMGLVFTDQQRQELGKFIEPFYIDYLPTREDVKALVEAANARDRAIILTEASTGLSGDICDLTVEQFKQGLARRKGPNEPVCLAPRGSYIYRGKTKIRMRPFLTSDAVQAIKIYLKSRRDDAPWLFVDRSGKQLESNSVNEIVQRLIKKAGLDIPKGQRLRMHNFRDFFKEACDAADVPVDWTDIFYGHKIRGSDDFYTHATEERAIVKFKKAEPHLSISRLSNMVLLRKQHEVALDDHERAELEGLKRLVGPEKFRRWAEFELAMKFDIKYNPETDYEPAAYRRQRILEEMLGEKGKE